jgi:hypothetical protein
MEDTFLELLNERLPDLDENQKILVLGLMSTSYEMGKNKVYGSYGKLKDTFEELLEMWGDFGKYNASRNHMEEDWKKQAGLL